MTNSKNISRRKMMGRSIGAATVGMTLAGCPESKPVPHILPDPTPRRGPGPNEKIGVGIIGCGRRNAQLQTGLGDQGVPPEDAQIVAVSDLNLTRAEQWGEHFGVPAFQDYKHLLDRDDVDAVIYATPEHWHYLPCIHAAQAGKDIYGEQPLSHTIREGRAMADAVRKYGAVFQTGEQQRSHPKTRHAAELILNGRIGKVKSIIGFNYPSPYECDFPEEPIPNGLDWNNWCGPNELVPYNTSLYLSRTPYNSKIDWSVAFRTQQEIDAVGPGWMSFRPYSGGELVNWGCHGLSMVQWVMQLDESGPVEVWVEPGDVLDAPVYSQPEDRTRGDDATDNTVINYRFENDVVLSLKETEDRSLGGGAKFIGEKGSITIIRNGYICDPEVLDEEPLPADAIRLYESDNHVRNFYDCVRSREDPIMNVEAGHRVATMCHLGNIARWMGRPLQWDPVAEEFPGDDEANELLDTPKRPGFELPEV
jgi:predicted dehydrogenase